MNKSHIPKLNWIHNLAEAALNLLKKSNEVIEPRTIELKQIGPSHYEGKIPKDSFPGEKFRMNFPEGIEKGETCNRNGCPGTIEEREKENSCSCHINPPCSTCVDDRNYCPVCDWQGIDDQKNIKTEPFNKDFHDKLMELENKFQAKWRGEVPVDEIDYRIRPHSNSSQLCEGVYPNGTTREQVEEKVRGTFGGRFEYFYDGRFKYIAYTD